MQLIEEVIKPFAKDRAVGIVDPLGGSSNVKHRTGGISLGARCGHLDRSGRPGYRIVRDLSTRAERQEQKREQGQTTRLKHEAIMSGGTPRFKTSPSGSNSQRSCVGAVVDASLSGATSL